MRGEACTIVGSQDTEESKKETILLTRRFYQPIKYVKSRLKKQFFVQKLIVE